MNWIQKNSSVILLLLLMISLVFIFGLQKQNQQPKIDLLEWRIDSLKQDNVKLSKMTDSLLLINDSLNFEIERGHQNIKQKESEIKNLNKIKNEEITRIGQLPVDSAVIFLSGKLSQENNFGQGYSDSTYPTSTKSDK